MLNFKELYKKEIIFLLLIFLSASLVLFTNQIILRDFKNSADEYSYFLQAQIFSNHRLSVSSPQNREFFDVADVINNGRFYSKFSPGWPFFLMWGIQFKKPMVVNLIFAILTIILIYNLAEFLFTEKIAKIAVLLMSCNAFFIFNSASYFAHPSTLFFLTLAMYVYFRNLKIQNDYSYFFIGLCVGIAFNIRSYTTFAVSFPFLVHEFYLLIKRKTKFNRIRVRCSLFALGFSIFLAIFLGYNYLQTSSITKIPFIEYNIYDTLGFTGKYAHTPSWSFLNNIILRTLILNMWLPFFIIFVIIAIHKTDRAQRTKVYLLSFIFLSLLIAYFFYPQSAGNEYGPRYLYCSSSAIFILMAVGIDKLPWKKGLIILLLVIFSISFFISRGFYFHRQINSRMELYDRIKDKKISHAIIFLKSGSGSMPANLLTRNSIWFNDDVLFVIDLKEKNRLLMKQYPNRDYYYWLKTKVGNKLIKIRD